MSKRVRPKAKILIQFGKKVREERTKLGLSQEHVGERARLSRNYIGEIERGETSVSLISIERIAKALGVEMWQLMKF